MAKKPTTIKGVNELARELGIAPPTVSRKRLAGKSDDQIKQERDDWNAKHSETEPGSGAVVSFTEAQRRKELALAEKHELDLAKARSEVVPLVEINQWIASMILSARDILLRIGPELRDRLAHESDPIAIQKLLDAEIDRALRRLAEFQKT